VQSLLINIPNNTLAQKVIWLLEHFKGDGVEIIPKDLSTPNEKTSSIDFGTFKTESLANIDGLTFQQKSRDEW